MSTDNEQFRPGFETWVLKNSGDHAKWLLARAGSGWYINVAIQGKWESWTAAKRDASTEPSYEEGAHAVDLLKHLRAKAASKGYVAIESAIDAAPVLSAALPDEATDAAHDRANNIDRIAQQATDRILRTYGHSKPALRNAIRAEIVAAIEAQKGGQQ